MKENTAHMKYFVYAIAILSMVFAYSCRPDVQMTEGVNHFGAEISPDGATDIAAGLSQLSQTDTVDAKIEGEILEVCQAKGCWMTLNNEGMDNEIFIKFKDYAFFVPKDASGKKAIVSGKLYNSITSVDELRHYAEDKGASAEEIAAITEPESELKMMAEGVIIYN